ncbi:cyanophycinase [Pedobacter sp. SYSU D00535]|uniref:cyanophycinase n=1 Tax=Pedobacter sp. SYSU D00535 TaxID=2810308 RepID=UPI001A95BF35|nr:cyanophycinase [Pedobacter sp. SYSU D00535]
MRTKPVNECPVPNGILVAIGGKENRGETPEKEVQQDNLQPLEVLGTFISAIKKENPKLEVVTTASSEGDALFEEYVNAFSTLNVTQIGRIHHEQREDVLKDEAALVDRIREADAVFFTGGDQLRLTTIYGGTLFLMEIKQRYIREHFVIGGTSAGAMAMSTPMIYAGNKDVQQISGEIKITTGLEFLKDVCIDTHFVDRGRFVRMAQVIATNPTCIGIGIEEDTAIVIKNGIEGQVCGSGIVIIIDGHRISKSNVLDFGTGASISIRGLQVDLLSRGDRFVIPQTNPPHI